mmetsp:Transcript_30496/g.78300  ORF Transcript_30496/g.78300 Transcript_30496/m.78300 type:complete len:238 (+) Transcript_30496:744-1457(+)
MLARLVGVPLAGVLLQVEGAEKGLRLPEQVACSPRTAQCGAVSANRLVVAPCVGQHLPTDILRLGPLPAQLLSSVRGSQGAVPIRHWLRLSPQVCHPQRRLNKCGLGGPGRLKGLKGGIQPARVLQAHPKVVPDARLRWIQLHRGLERLARIRQRASAPQQRAEAVEHRRLRWTGSQRGVQPGERALQIILVGPEQRQTVQVRHLRAARLLPLAQLRGSSQRGHGLHLHRLAATAFQ